MTNKSFEPGYLVALDEIYHSHWAARKRHRIEILREAVTYFWPDGHPAKLLHITGTNGKGSVAHYLEQGLRFAGNTGSWTGPHVFDYAERFHINGEIASHKDIVSIYRNKLIPYQQSRGATPVGKDRGTTPAGESLSFAELGILITLHLFEKYNVAWGIMEVGAGGRYTPLMALNMAACLLTNVGADHPKTLGTELWQRALEKAGIARKEAPFFTSAVDPALSYVRKTAEAEGAEVYAVHQRDITEIKTVMGEQPEFKLRNMALAVKLIRHFHPEFDFKQSIPGMTGSLTARFKKAADNILVDVSHNADKIGKLAEQLNFTYPGRKFRFIIGLTRSRDARDVFAPLIQLANHIVVTGASYAGQDPHEIAEILKNDFGKIEVIPEPEKAFIIEKERLKKDEILVLTGSAYMIDQALNSNPYIRHLNATYGRRGPDGNL